MEKPDSFDFWYAVNNTHVIRSPRQQLETFGNTVIDYHLLTEPMDLVNKTRVREGRIEAYKPQILTPDHFSRTLLEGFGDEASAYVDWLRGHEKDLAILQYGFSIRKIEVKEHLLSDNMTLVADRINTDLEQADSPLSALVIGVDEPWEVCLIKLMVDMTRSSMAGNLREFAKDPHGIRREIEQAFQRARGNRGRIEELGRLLQKHQLFEEYEDRFFQLVRSA